MATTLQRVGYHHSSVALLAGATATQDRMQAAIAGWLEDGEASANRTQILYCSCHARYDINEELWLLPHDASSAWQESRGAGVNVTELRRACLESRANFLIILDCCYSGAIATNNLGRLSRKWRQGPGRIFLTSCGPNDVTFYGREYKNSAMTAAILRNLPTTRHSARSLAESVKTYFSGRPHWGASVCAEERGQDFALVSKHPLNRKRKTENA